MSLHGLLGPLLEPAFTLGTTPTTWAELLGFVTGVVNVWLVVRQHIANWPIGIANVMLLGLIFLDGGLYAVTRCEVPKGDFDVIGKTWKRLVAWREDSPYNCGAHQWLEQSLPEDHPDLEFVLDLYLPIAE